MLPKRSNCLVVAALLLALCLSASAQSYSIRVKYNTNIRAQPSLEAPRLETAPAGSILEVLGQSKRWLRIQRTGEAWMASWVAHERVETVAADVDNCCGIDRVCQNDQEWIDGFWAFQNGQCQAPAASSPAPKPATESTAPVNDNCCGIDRVCSAEHEWLSGYWAYQYGQCGAPAPTSPATRTGGGSLCQHEHAMIPGAGGFDSYWTFVGGSCHVPAGFNHDHIRIEPKTAGFTELTNYGFDLLRRKAPEWYVFAVTGLDAVREVHSWAETGAYVQESLAAFHHAPYAGRPIPAGDHVTMAEFLVHEACHVHQYREGRGGYGLRVEYECAQKQLDAAYLTGPVWHHIHQLEHFIKNPHDQSVWWW